MNEEALDIVEELNAWADIVDNSAGKAHVVMLTGEVFVYAAAEIAMLRTLVRNLSTQKLEHDTKVRKMQLDHLTTLGELQEAAAEIKRLRAAGDALAINYELMLEQDWSSFLEAFLHAWREARRER